MKHSSSDDMPHWLSYLLLGGLAAIFVLLPFHAFLSTWGGTTIGPLWLWKSWKEILLLVLGVMAVTWIITSSRVFRQLIRDKWFVMICLYGIYSAVMAALYYKDNGSSATLAGLAMDERYFGVALLAYLTARYTSLKGLVRIGLKYWVCVGLLLAIAGIAQVLFLPHDFLTQFGYDKSSTIAPYVLIDQNPGALRAFATLRGPNDFGAFLIVPLLFSFLIRPKKLAAVFIAVMTLGLYTSASRSAWIGAAVALAALLLIRYGRAILISQRLRWGIVATCTALILLFVAAVTVPSVRLAVFHSSPGDSTLTEGSTDDHWKASSAGIDRIVAKPLGCGVGCSGPASYYSANPRISENYYLQIAEEFGVIGLVAWLVIAGITIKRLYSIGQKHSAAQFILAGFIGISVIGILLHVWSDDPLSMMFWLIIGLIIGQAARGSLYLQTENAHGKKIQEEVVV